MPCMWKVVQTELNLEHKNIQNIVYNSQNNGEQTQIMRIEPKTLWNQSFDTMLEHQLS